MVAPPYLEEGQSTTRPLQFSNGHTMFDERQECTTLYIMAKDNKLWDVIHDRPHVPAKEVKNVEIIRLVAKTRREYNEEDVRRLEIISRLRSYWFVG